MVGVGAIVGFTEGEMNHEGNNDFKVEGNGVGTAHTGIRGVGVGVVGMFGQIMMVEKFSEPFGIFPVTSWVTGCSPL
jgi:hypothetical protein